MMRLLISPSVIPDTHSGTLWDWAHGDANHDASTVGLSSLGLDKLLLHLVNRDDMTQWVTRIDDRVLEHPNEHSGERRVNAYEMRLLSH